MYLGTIMMLCGGAGLIACLVWIGLDSVGRSRRRKDYAEQAAQAVRESGAPSAAQQQITAPVTRQPSAQHSARFCPACGTPLAANAAFCRNCGRPVRR